MILCSLYATAGLCVCLPEPFVGRADVSARQGHAGKWIYYVVRWSSDQGVVMGGLFFFHYHFLENRKDHRRRRVHKREIEQALFDARLYARIIHNIINIIPLRCVRVCVHGHLRLFPRYILLCIILYALGPSPIGRH